MAYLFFLKRRGKFFDPEGAFGLSGASRFILTKAHGA